MTTNDRIVTGAWVPAIALRIALVLVACTAAAVLVPAVGWAVAAVLLAVLGAALPHSCGGWLAAVVIAIGMLLQEPSLWHAMLAVLVVHLLHAGSSLLLLLPWRSRVLLAALHPTGIRLLQVQLIAQPLTVLVMLAHRFVGAGIAAASIAGAVALGAFVVLFLRGPRRAGADSGFADRQR